MIVESTMSTLLDRPPWGRNGPRQRVFAFGIGEDRRGRDQGRPGYPRRIYEDAAPQGPAIAEFRGNNGDAAPQGPVITERDGGRMYLVRMEYCEKGAEEFSRVLLVLTKHVADDGVVLGRTTGGTPSRNRARGEVPPRLLRQRAVVIRGGCLALPLRLPGRQ